MGENKLNYIEETSRNFHAGMLSFVFQRVSGLALVLYLIMHLWSLSSILSGEGSFRDMMDAYNTPVFHFAEWLVLAAVAFHMLNGLRIIAVDWFGATRYQKTLFWIVFAVAAVAVVGSIPFFFLWR